MKKTIVSLFIIAGFIGYAIIHGKTQPSLPVTSSTPTPMSESSTSSPALSRYKDGEYTGDASNAFYGYIQVKAIISGGRLTDVQFLQYPNDHHESIEINTRAMPELTSEAIQAQDAHVDVVSGATDTSEAFIQSLTSALNQAQS